MSAVLVSDPYSRSRAVLLCLMPGKNDHAIFWASSRGGLLCSCLVGTLNALILSVPSRRTSCKFTSALRTCLADARILFTKVWSRIHLGSHAWDFAVRKQFESPVWVVLHRAVYSLVLFLAGSVARCIAPCCSRFRARCGYVNLARPLDNANRVAAERG